MFPVVFREKDVGEDHQKEAKDAIVSIVVMAYYSNKSTITSGKYSLL
jgi:hypothetical protein